jgi:hypothetical protein
MLGAVKGLFEYNRENFIFDRTLNQERVYQIQKMRIAQVKLYRDDLRELFDLTIRKMDTYLIVNALLLLFTGGLFYEGRLPQGTPAWVLWLWTMSLGSAFLFLSMSIWFAVHASITAQTFQVRLLTQWLRLPIPSAEDIHAVSGAATDFEEGRAGSMLRVPGINSKNDNFNLTEKCPDVPNELLKTDVLEDYTFFVEHFYLFRELQKHWQGFDAYSRIGMVVGTNMLLSAFSYMSLAYFVMSFKNWGGLVFPLVLTTFQVIHMKINIRNLSMMELCIMGTLIILPVLLASISGIQSVIDKNTFYANILSPVMFAACGGWIIFLVLIGSEDDGGLPCRFVTVGSIDVLGLDEDEGRFEALSPRPERDNDGDSGDDSSDASVDREGAETPVAVAVPPAPVVSKAEERRRRKNLSYQDDRSQDLQSTVKSDDSSPLASESSMLNKSGGSAATVSEVRYYPSLGAVEEAVEDEIPLAAIVETSMGGSSAQPSGSLEAEAEAGIAPADRNAEDEIRAYKYSSRVKSLPWRSYRETGAVLVCLWLFATAYSILSSFKPRWGWPQTLPHGDGEDETPIVPPLGAGATPVAAAQAADNHSRRLLTTEEDFVLRLEGEKEFGKLNVFSSTDKLLLSVDVVDMQHMFLDTLSTELVVIEREGDPRRFSLHSYSR